MAKPVLGQVGSNNKPVIPASLEKPDEWAFSFKHFKQIKYFGLDRTEPAWFVSLLARLNELSFNWNKETFFRNHKTRDHYRYHEINWDSTNVPIRRSDLNWLPKNYLENEQEYPFVQFGLSKANGRFAGFWNETGSIFYIVLLDPLHNLQPSKFNDYRINDCYPLSCEYTSLIKDIESIRAKNHVNHENCPVKEDMLALPTLSNNSNVVVGFLDSDFHKEYEKVIQKRTFTEIIEAGLMHFMENEGKKSGTDSAAAAEPVS